MSYMQNEFAKELLPILRGDKNWWGHCKLMGLTRQQIGEVRAFIEHCAPLGRSLGSYLIEEYRRRDIQVATA